MPAKIVRLCFLLLVLHTGVFAQQTAAPAGFPYNIELHDGNGKQINTAKLFKKRKKPLVLMFWLTTCAPCKMELTAIAGKYEAWKKEVDFDMYAISTDFPEKTEQFYKRVKESNWPFAAYHDFNRQFRDVMPGELNGLPQVFVLDKNGNIQYHTKKYSPGAEDQLLEAIKRM